MNDDVKVKTFEGDRTNTGQYLGSYLNQLAGTMFACIRNLPEENQTKGLEVLTNGVCDFMRITEYRRQGLKEGIEAYLKYRALMLGNGEKDGVVEVITKLSRQETPENWLRVFRGDI